MRCPIGQRFHHQAAAAGKAAAQREASLLVRQQRRRPGAGTALLKDRLHPPWLHDTFGQLHTKQERIHSPVCAVPVHHMLNYVAEVSPRSTLAVSLYAEGTRCKCGCFMGAGGGVEGNTACCTWQGGVMGELHGWHRHNQSISHCTAKHCGCRQDVSRHTKVTGGA